MIRKDYRLIADAMTEVHNRGDVDGIYNVLDALASVFKAYNERFDYQRFIDYATSKMTFEICPIYNETVLPDESGNCSLCGKHLA